MNICPKNLRLHIRGPKSQFFEQISAQNLSKILNVWVKVWTKQTQKNALSRQTWFATKARKWDKVWVQKRPTKRIFTTLLVSRQKRVFVLIEPGQWVKHMIPKTPGCARKPCLWQTIKRLFTMDVLSLWPREQSFLSSNWHFWQMTQMSDKCLLCKY